MEVLIVDAGGARGHALAAKVAESSHVTNVFMASGNPGTDQCSVDTGIDMMDIRSQIEFVDRNKKIGFVAVTADDPLAIGVVDAYQEAFSSRGLRVFGPTKAAAEIEWSKLTGKSCMFDMGVPTASGGAFSSIGPALAYAAEQQFPLYAKLDHLARGKGVFECSNIEQLELTLLEIKAMGKMGVNEMVIIEQGLFGPELSLQAWCDGANYRMVPFAMQDHKTIGDGDTGPMTGGMGVVTIPLTDISAADIDNLGLRFVAPKLQWLARRGTPFRGMLFPGLRGGKCLEDNARPGSPEFEAWVQRLKTDIVEIMLASSEANLDSIPEIEYEDREVVCKVLAADGYPKETMIGAVIEGVDELKKLESEGVRLYHGGTTLDGDGNLTVNGGRVFDVVVTGKEGESLESVRDRADAAAELIHFEGKQSRGDLGHQVIEGDFEDYIQKFAV